MRKAKLVRARILTPVVRELTFDPGPDFDFEPGQWVSFRIPAPEGEDLARSYSIASAPRSDGHFDIAVTRVEEGPGSNYLHGLQVGAEMTISRAQGFFTQDEFERPAILVATGTGVSPFRAILQALQEQGEFSHPVYLLLGVRTEQDILYRLEFEAIAEQRQFSFVPTLSRAGDAWSGRRGYVQKHLPELVSRHDGVCDVYVCGVSKMVKDVRKLGKRVAGGIGLFACMVGWAWGARAQVNVEAVRGDAERGGVSGRVEASVTGRTGNTEGIIAGSSGRIQYRAGRHLTFLYGTGNYTRLNQETSIAKAMAHLRYNYGFRDWIWGELFGQVEHDRFRRLTNRELIGAGPRALVFGTGDVELYYGTAYMAEWENVNLAEGDTGDALTLYHRWSHYLTLSVSLAEALSAGSTTYVQPRFDRFEDYRILNENYVEAGITDVISTKVSTWMRFDSEAPNEVEPADFLITNAFVAKF
ncbi:MAG: DUF481 domain-containing protein [Myxococcota bacterium]